MKRKLFLSAFAIGFVLAPGVRALAAPAVPGIGSELCRDPQIEAGDIMYEFPLFGDLQICQQICKLRRTKCIALVKLDLRCIIEVDKTEYGYYKAECGLLENKQDRKDCSNEAKQTNSEWKSLEKQLGQLGLTNCDDAYNSCLDDCASD